MVPTRDREEFAMTRSEEFTPTGHLRAQDAIIFCEELRARTNCLPGLLALSGSGNLPLLCSIADGPGSCCYKGN
jgi:hypothetical protein